jgi:hypothetical protein
MFPVLKKLGRLFVRFPADKGVSPQALASLGLQLARVGPVPEPVLVMQAVADKLYFMLFAAIRAKLAALAPCRADLLLVRSINGAIGTGWLVELKRSALAAWLFSNPWIRAYGSLADGVAYRSTSYGHPVQDWKDWAESKALWRGLQGKEEQFSLRIGGIEVADLLVDSYLRFRPSPTFDAADPFVRRLIWQALRDVRRANRYFGQVKPRWYISSYSTYLEHGIAVRMALKHQVPVWTFGNLNQFGKRLSSADSFHTADFSHYRSRFEALDSKAERLQAAQAMLDKRLAGGIDAATSYMRQSAYGRTDASLPQGLEGAVVVFLHDFYDSPHIYPDLVFQDFWRWICFTIEVLQQAGIRFFLKPHPNQIALSDAVLTSLRQKYPTLGWIASEVNNVQLVQAGIACGVTVYGTVAHELAYLGVPSIGCARHPHHTFDFCRTAQSREAYAALLRSFDVQPLPKAAMQEQALSFFYMHNLYGTPEHFELRNAFVGYWKLCDSKAASEADMLHALQALIELPAFDQFVQSMAESIAAPKLPLPMD